MQQMENHFLFRTPHPQVQVGVRMSTSFMNIQFLVWKNVGIAEFSLNSDDSRMPGLRGCRVRRFTGFSFVVFTC